MSPGRFAIIVVVSCLGACTWNTYDGPVADGGVTIDAGAKPAKLPAPMRDMGVYVNVNGDPKVYVVGGRDVQGKASKAVDVYDPATNTWTASVDMSTARYALGVGAFSGDTIVAVGGFVDGGGAVDVVEVRDPFAGVAAYVSSGSNAHVLAIGGYDGASTLDVVETCDVNTTTWR